MSIFEENFLGPNEANFVPLSPLSFLMRSEKIYPHKTALRYGKLEYNYQTFAERCRRLAACLQRLGIKRGEAVALLLPNTPPMLEAHFGVPMAGAVLNTLNIRLDAPAFAYILEHSEAKILMVDSEYLPVMRLALAQISKKPKIIVVRDENFTPTEPGPIQETIPEIAAALDYDEMMAAAGDFDFAPYFPKSEWEAIAVNYTSGTTGNPKGVVYHHRGANLNAAANIVAWNLPLHPVYLWTLPMFHCNGWCFPWTITLAAGVHVCLRRFNGQILLDHLRDEQITHYCGAPILMNMVLEALGGKTDRVFTPEVNLMTSGAAPPAALMEKFRKLGANIFHVYGLTEVYGPAVMCAKQSDWLELPKIEQEARQARQGVNYPSMEGLMVADPQTLKPVEKNGEQLGEVFMRGNIISKGYLKNPTASAEAFKGGWFHTGDLAVWHEDNYIELRDRSKDIIISGGENISTIEVEGVLYRHPDILEAAVVAKPDEKWGETPCAFVTMKPGATATSNDIIEFCRANLAHFKCPRTVIFAPLPRTATGKVQKYVLRQMAKDLEAV
ncbi:MAG: AMP-binding protein [Alphaproteobacteria bacterium]|nr:AMP-binding protein [Alphaproteobacteria bacterium]